jgi:hypothetical protein
MNGCYGWILIAMRKLIFEFLLFCLITIPMGCAYYPSEQAKSIKEANIQHIKHCTLLGQVYGSSNFGFLAMGVEIAKDKAKAQAAEIGATHVAWIEINSIGAPYALGKAYNCKF